MRRTKPETMEPLLCPQEYTILKHMWDGLQRKEIADAMGLADATVKNYIHNLYGKLQVKTGIQAIRRAMEMKLLQFSHGEEWP